MTNNGKDVNKAIKKEKPSQKLSLEDKRETLL